MKTLRQAVAIFSATLMLAPVMTAQQYSWQTRQHSWLTDPYRPKEIAPLNLANSDRLEALLRAGNLYLSLQDAIALALENNLDVDWTLSFPGTARRSPGPTCCAPRPAVCFVACPRPCSSAPKAFRYKPSAARQEAPPASPPPRNPPPARA